MRLVVALLIGGLGVGSAPPALSDNTVPASSPDLLIDGPLSQQQSRVVLDCVEKKTPERLQVLASLEISEKKIEERFATLQKKLAESSDASDSEVQKLFARLYSETEEDLSPHFSESSKDGTLNAYRRGEASRILAETALRLCIAGAGDPATVDLYRRSALENAKKGFDALSKLDSSRRQSSIPAVLARMARTELSIEQLDQMREVSPLSPGQRWERMSSVLEKYRKVSGAEAERRELDLIQLESALSLAGKEIGSPGGVSHLSPAVRGEIDSLKASVNAGVKLSKNKRYLSRARHLSELSQFYFVGRLDRQEALKRLEGQLQSSDPVKRRVAEGVALDVIDHFGGTVLGRQMLDLATRSGKEREFLSEVENYQASEKARAEEHDLNLEKAVGAHLVQKLGLARYDELVNSDGSLKEQQQDYVQALAKLAEIHERMNKSNESASQDELIDALDAADLKWTYLQCERQQVGIATTEKAVTKTPFGSYDVDLSKCAQLRGRKDSLRASHVAGSVINEAISRRTRSKITWIAGEFAFDVVTVLASGGVSALVKTSVKTGIKKTGVALLRRELLNPAVIKVGTRATSLVSSAVVTDVSMQALSSGREFLEAGLKGHWSSDSFKENFVYTQKDSKVSRHATRLLATALASQGLEALWGRARFVAPRLAERFSSNRAGKWLGESGKSAINSQLVGLAGDVASVPFDGCSILTGTDILNGQTWMNTMASSILSRVKVGPVPIGRFSGLALDRLDDFEIDTATSEQIEQLKACALPEEPAPNTGGNSS